MARTSLSIRGDVATRASTKITKVLPSHLESPSFLCCLSSTLSNHYAPPYPGWFSLHVLAYCNSFHLFTMYKTGATGRMSDNTALQTCEYFQNITEARAAWLGDATSYIAGDGGTSDPHGILITPFRNPQEIQQKWYNFCHSSTRFFIGASCGVCVCAAILQSICALFPSHLVQGNPSPSVNPKTATLLLLTSARTCIAEETFGRWKNRFRFLLKDITSDITSILVLTSVKCCTTRSCRTTSMR